MDGGGGQHPVGLTFMTGASTLRATAQGVRQPAGATLEYILHKIGPLKITGSRKFYYRAAISQPLMTIGSLPGTYLEQKHSCLKGYLYFLDFSQQHSEDEKKNSPVLWIRIRIGSGFDGAPGTGSGSVRTKMTHKN
jgi:hypothetical protein